MAREKVTELYFQLNQGLGGTGGFHRYPRPRAAGKGLCRGQRVSGLLLALPHPHPWPLQHRALRLPLSLSIPLCMPRAGKAGKEAGKNPQP